MDAQSDFNRLLPIQPIAAVVGCNHTASNFGNGTVPRLAKVSANRIPQKVPPPGINLPAEIPGQCGRNHDPIPRLCQVDTMLASGGQITVAGQNSGHKTT